MITLNQRLLTVCSHLKNGTLADIGSDHAYLPIYAIQNNLCSHAVAGEVISGPFNAANHNVELHQLNQYIDVRRGDGLTVIGSEEHIDNITICGMGGPLIAKILEEGYHKLTRHPRLILQSNIQSQTLRKVLSSLNYEIINEDILEEKGHIYEIVVAEYNPELKCLSKYEEKFGPYLLNNINSTFKKKWIRELKALEDIKSHLNSTTHHERLEEIECEMNLIQEVLMIENK
ncbi:tRNA (adenine(22)-N(1))-methyltransferase TrmK [Staphylococcus saccharolyticus]|uniref:tRNA (adenine(22)-N(1))-methyltransferase n=1 Tax=Staphylococcus saccharolyticus TaxID=33028 RepID=UPI00102DE86E|nr:tRNA (adenine(22)-N(1))-methyltransferase TrmK [Staphylococcus saccharolyticus]MBL7573301.1 tRNA (adenine(22)-N(1))-methyltransferase TrmK [Staphylococcus saccharolyticus]MBL7583764.1 tRNA (adenine(22)-N(1))-methyltransferase TrmK [Staphylococcus saccharolyticus]MBL7638918.1 tRNA (adenine(22)-N(1))-methyltransferase TrmK [Staphylococcus saccharolyticus]QRJ67607.1 tRNA (adenine(22)-N(1))-methyltransferase TrmK [Staphylococcus saccharolyticus]TAA93829.1 tRNA methyltransferase [Staphylococcus 